MSCTRGGLGWRLGRISSQKGWLGIGRFGILTLEVFKEGLDVALSNDRGLLGHRLGLMIPKVHSNPNHSGILCHSPSQRGHSMVLARGASGLFQAQLTRL